MDYIIIRRDGEPMTYKGTLSPHSLEGHIKLYRNEDELLEGLVDTDICYIRIRYSTQGGRTAATLSDNFTELGSFEFNPKDPVGFERKLREFLRDNTDYKSGQFGYNGGQISIGTDGMCYATVSGRRGAKVRKCKSMATARRFIDDNNLKHKE